MMLSLNLDSYMESQLDSVAKESGLSKAKIAIAAIAEYLQDRVDYAQAIRVLERDEATYSLSQVKAELGLAT
jgi:predicted DNA-binding protein